MHPKNIVWHESSITTEQLEELQDYKGVTIWFTGLSGSGKSTIANALAKELLQFGAMVTILDGDNIRHGLNSDLGFSPEDRVENIRRIAEVAKLFSNAAVINLVAFISPYKSDRDMARKLQPDRFIEVYCDSSLQTCESRDVKGLYKRARAGEIDNFTGVSAPYEPPDRAEIHLNTELLYVEDCVNIIIDYLFKQDIVR